GRERVEHVLDLFARRSSVAHQACLEDHEEEGQAVDRDVPRLAGEELEAGLLLDESELAEAEGQPPLLPADDDLVGLDHDSVTSPEICSTSVPSHRPPTVMSPGVNDITTASKVWTVAEPLYSTRNSATSPFF